MNERQLRYFCTIAREENIQKAAAVLHKDSSTLTRTVKNMEEEIDAPLFKRTREGLVLTAEGETTIRFARKVLETTKECHSLHSWTEQEIRYLLEVNEQGRISAAAEKLFVAQPSLSQKLWQIEKDLGNPLFERNRRGVRSTEYGKHIIETLKQVEELYRQYRKELEECMEMKKGTVTVGIPMNLGTCLLPAILPAFARQYPKVKVNIREGNSSELEKLLLEKKVDFCIMHEHDTGDMVQLKSFSEDPFYLVIPRMMKNRLPFKEAQQLSAENLKKLQDVPFVMVAKRQKLRQVTDQILENAGIIPEICCTTRNMETAKRLVAAGMGVTILPQSYLTLYSGTENLEWFLLDKSLNASWKLVMANLKGEKLSGCSRRFYDFAMESFQKSLI
ncbi:LysR family transcriptional regulator [Blautia sp. MSJ-19]|uniref:LysR family transcriptional regulator n=1 Tax=Blautia sp. MSJ-19 TaxID=2841517 RepID=UPI001C0F3728|nr:LysR family transcriptional regulator [Blautia sp. MSJ-19]MBU5481676.1 LysR family transcriptional regulator [Blautia sp. MSJ-19]